MVFGFRVLAIGGKNNPVVPFFKKVRNVGSGELALRYDFDQVVVYAYVGKDMLNKHLLPVLRVVFLDLV